jgi:hypothetical protein
MVRRAWLVQMFVWLVLTPITASSTAIAAGEEGETGAAAGHAAACAADYAPENGEHDEPTDDDRNNDGPPETETLAARSTQRSEN